MSKKENVEAVLPPLQKIDSKNWKEALSIYKLQRQRRNDYIRSYPKKMSQDGFRLSVFLTCPTSINAVSWWKVLSMQYMSMRIGWS